MACLKRTADQIISSDLLIHFASPGSKASKYQCLAAAIRAHHLARALMMLADPYRLDVCVGDARACEMG